MRGQFNFLEGVAILLYVLLLLGESIDELRNVHTITQPQISSYGINYSLISINENVDIFWQKLQLSTTEIYAQ